jgi:hypothetical protein
MPVGSSLGLLFKVGVDAGDAQKAFQQLMATNKEFAKGVEDGMKAEAQAFAGANTALKATTDSARQLGVTFNDVRIAIGRLIGGLTLVRAFREISQSIEEIGTRSKEDFDTLQRQVESAGGHITELQRNISQELLGAFDRLKGASAGFMAEVIETSGPALINLLKDIADWLGRLRPLAAAVGDDLADTFNRLNALGRTIEGLKPKQQGVGSSILEALFPPLAAKRALDDMGEFDDAYAKHLKNIQEENKKFVASPAGTDSDSGKIKKARKDLTDAALEQAQAENALTLVRQDAAIADKQINEDQAKGLITQEEGAKRRIAVLAELQKAETAALDARQKAVEADPTLLANQRAKQLNDIDTQRAVLRTQAAEAQREEDNKTIAADQKLHDAFAKHFDDLKKQWLTYAEFIHDRTDEIVADLARQAQAVPGGGGVGPIPGAPPPVPLPPTSIFDDLGAALQNSGAAFTTWSDFASKAISGVAGATENLLETFILTGKGGGQIFKQLAASIIASLAVEAGVRAIMEVAFGIADLAKAASAAANPFTAALAPGYIAAAHVHFAAAQTFGIIAGAAAAVGIGIGAAGGLGGGGTSGAAAGGGFGGETKPGEVTINQGSPGTLGIQLLSDIHSMLSTASPGDIVTRGAEQNPVAIGQANNEASRRDGSISREFLQISGLRTA